MIPEIKSRIGCVEYARSRGLSISKPGDRCISPLRTDASNRNSFVVYDDFFYDFGASRGGDVIDLCAMLEHGGDRRRAIHDLAARVGAEREPDRDWVRATQRLNNLIQRWHEQIPEDVRAYLHARRITDETIAAYKLGYTGRGEPDGYCARRICIPFWKNSYVYSYAARASQPDQEPKYLKRRNDDLSDRSAPWGMNTLSRTDKPLIIAEGAFDALAFAQESYPVLATMGGHFSREQLKTVLSAAHNYTFTCLTFDADGPGAEFTLRLAQALFRARVPFRIAPIPAPHKDASDYYAAGGDLADLVDSAQPGHISLALSITDESEFRAFIYDAARTLDDADMARVFSEVRRSGRYDPDWLSALQKTASKPPSEDVVARRVVKTHQLRYLENVGFYEYGRGCWRKLEDTQVQGYIGAELGKHRTGARLSTILRIVKTDTLTDQPFDRKPVFNFINGTLELGPEPKFREHRPDDLCSVQADYPYDPHAVSPEWTKFISDVCDDDDKRAQLLQEIAGYVLFHDCSLEKLFVFQGEGGNGKSVYINILEAVFGTKNVSHVSVAGIMADFQRILLSTSLLNVATEINANLAGSDEYLKQIASGEAITACYKGKNFVSFNPRSKLIFAVNGQLKSADVSDGLSRRLCIVNFTQAFVDYPNGPGQRQRDTQLQSKLLRNLPAIFNWCLNGYTLLMNTRDFTTMEDEQIAKQEFKEASNPIITFVRECEIVQPGGSISKTELRDKWKQWALENGHLVGSSMRLYREAKKLFPYGTKEVDSTMGGERFRGFVFPSENPESADII